MLGNLNPLVSSGGISAVGLQGSGAVFEKRRPDDRYQHDGKGKQNGFHRHAARQNRPEHDADRRNFQRRKKRRRHAEDDGNVELPALPPVAEMKEFPQNLKHVRHLLPHCRGTQYARSKETHTADRFAAVPSGFPLLRYAHHLPPQSGRRPRWWKAGGQ